MITLRSVALAAVATALLSPAVLAGEAKLTGTHLCCGMCVKDVEATIKKVEGLSNLKIDREASTVTFEAADKKTAGKGLRALANAGFGGKATFDGANVALPKTGIEKGAKSDKVVLTGVHLCCGTCVKAVTTVAEEVKDVAKVEVDREAKTVTLTGKQIDVAAAAKALNEKGFYGKLEGAAKKKDAEKPAAE